MSGRRGAGSAAPVEAVRKLPASVARTDYGGPVTAMIASGNVAGTQFHPEKSQTLGLKLIANFLKWRP